MFSLLAKVVMGIEEFESVRESLKGYCVKLIKDAILPNCVWRAGRYGSLIDLIAAKQRSIPARHLDHCMIDSVSSSVCFQQFYKVTSVSGF